MTKRLGVAAIAMLGLVATACGGGGDSASATPDVVIEGIDAGDDAGDDAEDGAEDGAGSAGADPANSVAGGSTDEELALEFAQCMRDHGLDWADPTVGADGSIDLLGGATPPGGAGGGIDENTQAAFEECGPIIEGASFLPGGGEGIDAETQDRFLEFTQCLRDNGVDVDDPDFGNFGPGAAPAGGDGDGEGGGPLGDFDPEDPANAAALDACQGLFAGGAPFGGGD